MAGAQDVLAELFLVRREDADATPTARDGDIPLLRVCRRLDGGGYSKCPTALYHVLNCLTNGALRIESFKVLHDHHSMRGSAMQC